MVEIRRCVKISPLAMVLLGFGSGTRLMAFTQRSHMAMSLVAVLFVALWSSRTDATSIGAVYGRNGDNIPPAATAAALMQQYEISRVRIYDHDPAVISAFASTQIRVMIGVTNDEITPIGLSQASADDWVNKYVAPYIRLTNINAIAVGSEVITNSPSIASVLVPAMQNLHTSLVKLGYDSSVKVSSPHGIGLLDVSYPPSNGQFGASVATTVHSMLDFLQQTGAPFMLNVYPFLAYLNSVSTVPLDYALFQPATPVTDVNNGLVYNNLYDAQIDAVIAAMARLNKSVAVTVTETGWPSDGEAPATYANARTYNQNLVKRTMNNSGTPMRPNVEVDAYIVSLYDEDLRPTPPLFNLHWGLFFANGTFKYGFSFLNGSDTNGGAGGGGGGGGGGSPGTPSPPPASPSPPGTTPGGAVLGQKVWCVAKGSAFNTSLQQGIDWACGPGKAKCDPIQEGGDCYLPNTYFSHASYAFNIHYHWFQTDPRSCIFGGDAELTYVDPSYGNCHYVPSSAMRVEKNTIVRSLLILAVVLILSLVTV